MLLNASRDCANEAFSPDNVRSGAQQKVDSRNQTVGHGGACVLQSVHVTYIYS